MSLKTKAIIACSIICSYGIIADSQCFAMQQPDKGAIQSTVGLLDMPQAIVDSLISELCQHPADVGRFRLTCRLFGQHQNQHNRLFSVLCILVPYLSFSDLPALHTTCRGLRFAWNHERPIDIILSYASDLTDQLQKWVLVQTAMKARNPIDLRLTVSSYENLPDAAPQLLTQLQVLWLHLRSRDLSPAAIVKVCNWFPQLQEFDASYCNLKTLPDNLQPLTQLRVLNLSDNSLKPAEIAKLCNWFPQLQELDLSDNDLRTLPEDLNPLTYLRVLNLRSNSLNPADIAKVSNWCPRLQELDLSWNAVGTLPDNLQLLTQLQVLKLQCTRIKPEEVANVCNWFPHIQKLNLMNNGLETLPYEITLLTKLSWLQLGGNNFSAAEQDRIRQLLKQSAPNAFVIF